MAIKEIPVNTKTYYKCMKEEIEAKKNFTLDLVNNLRIKINAKHDEILSHVKEIEEEYKINLLNYDEFFKNEYIDGKFLKVSKALFFNKSNNYELVGDLFNIYDLATDQKVLKTYENEIALYDKMLNLSLKEYTEILKIFYTEVHRQLIVEGKGYSFGNRIGWICINRCKIRASRNKKLDWNKTKLKRAELIAKGERIYNKEEAEWCEKNGIEYNAADPRVFMNKEYCYEVPLLDCKLTNGDDLILELTSYRGREIRHMKEENFIAYANGDINKIIELPLDLKTKINLCDKIDKILYTKFIRNESQVPHYIKSLNRKNR